MPDVICPYCGTSNYRKPSKVSREYCNQTCFNDYRRSRHFGERYGRYTIVDFAVGKGKYLAECDCGTIKTVRNYPWIGKLQYVMLPKIFTIYG